ncbi:MAG TPA: undecaprenyldiphospho-muramoylpentapeptide beta-N-acetylglucosaminyltransferase [Treponema sp.]|nr:undecaprenyldiphospho-muramoylpentapeptide beta-N-acetylglucosaminyltransferase [Treponema sp.]
MNSLVFVGGGTGGHIFPGLAVIEALKEITPDSNIVWLGSSRGMDRSIVESAGVSFYGIPSGKFRRYFSFKNITDLFRIFVGFFVALYHLKKLKPLVVFSKGGFVSVPPCYAAALLGIPVLTHECDFTPGLATRLNARVAKKIFISYEETVSYLAQRYQSLAEYTGNPVRSAFYHTNPAKGRQFLGFSDKNTPVVFVQGGSLGARQINELTVSIARRLSEHCFIVHQTGAGNRDAALEEEQHSTSGKYRSFEFIREEMPHVLSCADLVVSRAGANSVWECATAGKPMVLIPLEASGSRGDQIDNARFYEERGAATVLGGSHSTAENLYVTIKELLDNSEKLATMAEKSAQLGKIQASHVLAKKILETAGLSVSGEAQ